jgi:hypothetical protein
VLFVLSNPDDPVAVRMSAELAQRGAQFAVINPSPLAGERLRIGDGPRGPRVIQDGRSIDLADVEAVWVWRPGASTQERREVAARGGDPALASYVESEWFAVLSDLLRLDQRRWIPGTPSAIRKADGKLGQLKIARALGFAVPEHLVTNDPDQALAFAARFEGAVIAKAPSIELAGQFMPRGLGVYTLAPGPRMWAAIESIRHAPVMLQQRITKRFELRVTVVGARVFAAAIHSQATRRTQLDWRHYDHEHTPYTAHELPDDVAARCAALVRTLGLAYGAIDLIVTPEGEHVFLEINPNGQWGGIESRTGLPITAALCDELTRAQEHAA